MNREQSMSGETLVATHTAPSRTAWPKYLALVLALVAVASGVRGWLPAGPSEPRRTALVSRGELVSQTLATGRIVPREEIFVRSLVAGVLAELTAHPGDVV